MTHAEMDELYDLFVLGALEPELAAEIEQHLQQQCAYCIEHVQDASQFAAVMAGIAEPRQAPSHLRERILQNVVDRKPRRSKGWIAAVVGLAAACVALFVFALVSRNESSRLRQQITALRSEVAVLDSLLASAVTERSQTVALRAERDRLRAAVDIMSGPATRNVPFGNPNSGPRGRVFVNNLGGLVFAANRLPRLPANRTFELWVMPRTGNPRPAGLFRPTAAGDSLHVSPVPAYPSQTKAVAVSIEPRQGSPAPTTTPILVVPLP